VAEVGRTPVRPLVADTWYTLKWRATRSQVDVWVDGKLVYSQKGKFEFTKKAPIRVQSQEHVVDVKSLAVAVLPDQPGKGAR
jgi:hypothetical protein